MNINNPIATSLGILVSEICICFRKDIIIIEP
jgi:hypothetical protein